jgi:hypothetical protein
MERLLDALDFGAKPLDLRGERSSRLLEARELIAGYETQGAAEPAWKAHVARASHEAAPLSTLTRNETGGNHRSPPAASRPRKRAYGAAFSGKGRTKGMGLRPPTGRQSAGHGARMHMTRVSFVPLGHFLAPGLPSSLSTHNPPMMHIAPGGQVSFHTLPGGQRRPPPGLGLLMHMLGQRRAPRAHFAMMRICPGLHLSILFGTHRSDRVPAKMSRCPGRQRFPICPGLCVGSDGLVAAASPASQSPPNARMHKEFRMIHLLPSHRLTT